MLFLTAAQVDFESAATGSEVVERTKKPNPCGNEKM